MERKLAAILAADVVGYSKLMGADEGGTLAALRAVRADLISPQVEQSRGVILKSMGDGWFIEFQSVTDAASCALALQDAPNVFVADSGQLTVSYLMNLTGVEGSVLVLPAPPHLPPLPPPLSPPPSQSDGRSSHRSRTAPRA